MHDNGFDSKDFSLKLNSNSIKNLFEMIFVQNFRNVVLKYHFLTIIDQF